jgi:hypothetical protein
MGGVLVLAKQPAKAQVGPTAGPGRVPTERDKYGPPQHAMGSTDDFSGCGQLDPDKPPAVEFVLEDGTLQMGELKQGVKIEREVGFRSTGKGPLCVADVSTGCGCLKASLVGEKKRFEPGEEGRIRVVIDTTGRVGKIRKQVEMITNALKSPRKSFRVEMKIAVGLIAEPRYIQFGSVSPKQSSTKELILRSPKDDAAWVVTGVEGARPIPGRGLTKFTYEVEPVEDPRYRKFRLMITHPGFEQVGPLRDVVRIRTTHPDRPVIEVSGHINVNPRIRSTSRVISLGFVRAGSPRPPMRARFKAGVPGVTFEIVRVEVLPPPGREVGAAGVGFKATSGKDDRGWWVDVSYDGKTRKEGLLQARLVAHTDDAEQPTVVIPIRATVRAPRTPK